MVFVFDSLGKFLHSPGSPSVVAPSDLRQAPSPSSRVTLQWTARTSGIASYQLQRAAGFDVRFVNVGPQLPGNATTTTDSAVVPGTSYRYQLVARNASGDSSSSNLVSVAVAAIGELSRTVPGLLFRDTFDRPDGAVGTSWTIESGSWQIVNRALQVASGSAPEPVIRLTAVAARKDFHVQVLTSRSLVSNYATIYLRRANPTTLFQADLGSSTDGGRASVPRVYRKTSGAFSLIGYGTAASMADTVYRLTYSVLGPRQRFWVEGSRQVTAQDANNDVAGYLALEAYPQGGSGTVRFRDLIVCSARTVTVTGLPVGYRVRVAGVPSAPATTSGVVSVDLFATMLPVAQLEILNDQDVVVKVFAPVDGVWGGDQYALGP